MSGYVNCSSINIIDFFLLCLKKEKNTYSTPFFLPCFMPILSIAPCYAHLGTQEAVPSKALGRERETWTIALPILKASDLCGVHTSLNPLSLTIHKPMHLAKSNFNRIEKYTLDWEHVVNSIKTSIFT